MWLLVTNPFNDEVQENKTGDTEKYGHNKIIKKNSLHIVTSKQYIKSNGNRNIPIVREGIADIVWPDRSS